MNVSSSNNSKEQVYDDLRQLVARESVRVAKRDRISRVLRACDLGSERIAELLQTRVVLSLAGCLSLVFLASVFMTHSPDKNVGFSADLTTLSDTEPAPLED